MFPHYTVEKNILLGAERNKGKKDKKISLKEIVDLLEAAAVPSLFLILIASLFIIVSSKYILRENNE